MSWFPRLMTCSLMWNLSHVLCRRQLVPPGPRSLRAALGEVSRFCTIYIQHSKPRMLKAQTLLRDCVWGLCSCCLLQLHDSSSTSCPLYTVLEGGTKGKRTVGAALFLARPLRFQGGGDVNRSQLQEPRAHNARKYHRGGAPTTAIQLSCEYF